MKKNNLLTCPSVTGFTLIELSVVLAIIALVAGGVYAGKSLLDNAKYRNIGTNVHEYIAAIDQFHDKYKAYPGDMATAVKVWGKADGDANLNTNCADPDSDRSTSNIAATCNGDGDGTIARGAGEVYEMFRAWQHLQSADLIKGNYSGIAGAAGSNQAIVDQNIPGSDFEQSGYDIVYLEDGALGSEYFSTLTYQHVLHFGKQVSGNNLARGAALSAADAYNLDNKLDDRLPGSGKIVTFNNTAQNSCASTDSATTAAYLRANQTGLDCTLIFITGY